MRWLDADLPVVTTSGTDTVAGPHGPQVSIESRYSFDVDRPVTVGLSFFWPREDG